MTGKITANKKIISLLALFSVMVLLCFSVKEVYATDLIPYIDLQVGTTESADSATTTIQLMLLFALITFAPSILLVLTCFTRIIIVLGFVRTALGTQSMPPNQVLIGVALFLTLFLMGPTFLSINENAVVPYSQGQISTAEALNRGMEPIREFMFLQVETKDMQLFAGLSGETFETQDDIPNRVLIPAFILGEVTKGFRIGIFVYIPSIIIDMVVASVLMAMGMMMLPPAMISSPIKLLFFVMVDGWPLIIESLVMTFR